MDEFDLLVTEDPVTFDGHTWSARRGPAQDTPPRWQVFRDDEVTPVGFLQGHRCELTDEPRLLVFGPGNEPLFFPKPGKDDGCVGSLLNALHTLTFTDSTRIRYLVTVRVGTEAPDEVGEFTQARPVRDFLTEVVLRDGLMVLRRHRVTLEGSLTITAEDFLHWHQTTVTATAKTGGDH